MVHSAAKLFFAYGLGNAMTFPLSVGATAALWPYRPSPDAVFEMMRKHRPTIFYGVPSLYTALLAHPDIGKGAGSDRLRICVSAGEALPAHIGERWREIVGVDVLDGIGSTELLQTFLSNRPGDIRYGSTGKPVPGYEARIVDENGRELGTDEIGELIIRGPSAGEGYWNQRGKSRRTFAGEWTYTGDKYRRDADGYYYYCGRTDDMFKVSGMWVSPFDVEAALMSHEAVLEAAVIGKQDADGLVKPKAFIVLKNGYVADEGLLETLKVHVKEHAGPWKYPRWIDVRSDLPRTATGKIQRFKLREEDVGGSAQSAARPVRAIPFARRSVGPSMPSSLGADGAAADECGFAREPADAVERGRLLRARDQRAHARGFAARIADRRSWPAARRAPRPPHRRARPAPARGGSRCISARPSPSSRARLP